MYASNNLINTMHSFDKARNCHILSVSNSEDEFDSDGDSSGFFNFSSIIISSSNKWSSLKLLARRNTQRSSTYSVLLPHTPVAEIT